MCYVHKLGIWLGNWDQTVSIHLCFQGGQFIHFLQSKYLPSLNLTPELIQVGLFWTLIIQICVTIHSQ